MRRFMLGFMVCVIGFLFSVGIYAGEVETSWSGNLNFESDDDLFSMQIRGRIQPRYEYTSLEDEENVGEFSLRRVRLDFRGHAINPDFTYRLMPEFGGNATLRDAWVQYRVSENSGLRFGQYNISYAWERDVSSNRQAFVERSLANNEFQWASGRDNGLMWHGKGDNHRWGAGVFSGNGRADHGEDATQGHLYAARTAVRLLGEYPGSEALLNPVRGQNLSIGAGVFHANRVVSERQGSLELSSDTGDTPADLTGLTADINYQVGSLSLHVAGFYRSADFASYEVSTQRGSGYTLQGGYLLSPEKYFLGFRFSEARADRANSASREREYGVSLHNYHHGHSAKFVAEILRQEIREESSWEDNQDAARVQYQFLF